MLNSLHGSHLGHNILLFVERLSSCVTSAKNTTPPLTPTLPQLTLPPSLPPCLPPSLPPSLPPCLLSSHCVSLFQRVIRRGEGRGEQARVGGPLIQGVLLTSAGRSDVIVMSMPVIVIGLQS